MRKLLWKEWHEQSWKLGFGCLVLGAMAVIGLRARIIADIELMDWVCFVSIALLPVLSSTGLLPAEREEGSFETLLALPIQPWKILLTKTAMGVLLCAGPMLVTAVASLWIAGGREIPSSNVLSLFCTSTLTIVSLFFWMMALTSRLPSEARAALLATGITIIWLMASPLLFLDWTASVDPFAFVAWRVYQGIPMPNMPLLIIVQLITLSGLWFGTWRLFTRVEDQQ